MTVIKMKVHLENILHYREVNHDCSHDFKNIESSNKWSIKLMAALQIGLSKKKAKPGKAFGTLMHGQDKLTEFSYYILSLYPTIQFRNNLMCWT